MDEVRDVVIVGAGLAAAKAAEALRDEGYARAITIFGEEPLAPYERPPLSKDHLAGGDHDPPYVHPEAFYADRDIDLRTATPVTAIDRASGHIETAGGRHRFDRLLLATGSRARRLPGVDGDLPGVHLLRTVADSERLAKAFTGAHHVAVIGAGWIGCEVAAAARGHDLDVTMIDPLDVPLQRVLGDDVGRVFAEVHADHQVDLRLGVGVSSVQGHDHVEAVTLTDGQRVDADLVVVGIGASPRVELAEQAGLACADGVVVDATLVSSDPRILAAGDIAAADLPWLRERVRVEHWANALNQGTVAGRNLLGRGEVYDRVPYFFTDQYDLGMEYSGYARGDELVVFRGDPATRDFIAFWLDAHGRVAAGMNCNVWGVTDDIQRLVRSRLSVEAARLTDPDVPLGDVVSTR